MKVVNKTVIDNFYSCHVDYRRIFKHVFMPDPKYGKNSKNKIKSSSNIVFPDRRYSLTDSTKILLNIGKDVI